MIKVRFSVGNRQLKGFEISGHAMFAESGRDVVCAAVSSAAYMAANTITDVIGADAVAEAGEASMRVELKQPDEQAETVLKGLELHLTELSKQYPQPFTAYLKVAEGCNNCCTYCAIPKIRGKMRSRSIEDCVAEAKVLAEKGVTELIVVAQDTTAYGEDIYGKPMLPKLLKELCKIEKLHWIRTLYTYPERITDQLIKTVKEEDKLIKYFDIPLQHINQSILKRMNRKGNKESISSLIDKIRTEIPDVTLRTTFITGFPGETEEQFTELAEFVKKTRFDRLGCFTYSVEEDTAAALMPDQIDEQTKQSRLENIMEMQMGIAAEKNGEKTDTVTEVLIEGWDDYIKCYFGRTVFDAPEVDGKIFFMSTRPLVIGEYVKVRINDCIDYDLLGELEE